MSKQWAVVVRPDGTHNVRALGPIQNQETAERVVERIQEQQDRIDRELEDLGYSPEHGLLPQAVPLESVSRFVMKMKDTRGEDLV